MIVQPPRFLQRTTLLVTVLLLMLAVLTALRAVFWGVFASTGGPVAGATLARAFYIGMKLDLRLVLLLLVPLALAGLVRPLDPTRSVTARGFWINHLTLLMTLLLPFYAIDLGNYGYLGERLDASALRYLKNPVISLGMVWETYPVLWGFLGFGLFATGYRFVLGRLWPEPRCGTAADRQPEPWWRQTLLALVLVAAYLGGIYGKISYYPLRWSDAFFTDQKIVSDLALNPVLFLANTLCTAEGELAYDMDQVAAHYEVVADYLEVEPRDVAQFGLARYVRPTLERDRPTNIVLIFGESFAAHKTGTFGNPLDPSPSFDALVDDGLLFTNFYSPRTGTARGVFGTLTGIPDTITYRTASRNPMTISHHTILRSFEDHEKFYFLGGSANWANVRALFSHNVRDMKIYEEGSFEAARADIWGIPDYRLLEEANRVLRETEAPFFAFIHLAGNHRPYTIPDNVPGFELRQVDDERLRRAGFDSLDEFNSFRLLDFSLGHYLEIARKEDYFEDTVVLILSDNGGLGRTDHMDPCTAELGLGNYHAPLLIYSPHLIPEGRRVDSLASQIDIMPTAAGLAGIPALNTTLGRNLLDPRFADDAAAFVYRKRGSDGEIAVLEGENVVLLNADGTGAGLRCPAPGSPEDSTTARTEQVAAMSELGLGLFHASKYLLYHNTAERYDALGLPPINPEPTPEASPAPEEGDLAERP